MPSQQFKASVALAWEACLAVPDDSLRFCLDGWGNQAEAVPIWLDDAPNPAQQEAAGCTHCTFLGLWSDAWPGYPHSTHGHIWLFEAGIVTMRQGELPANPDKLYLDPFLTQIRREQGAVIGNIAEVLIHECGHALQRDHVLDAIEAAKASGLRAQMPGTAACGVCPGRGY